MHVLVLTWGSHKGMCCKNDDKLSIVKYTVVAQYNLMTLLHGPSMFRYAICTAHRCWPICQIWWEPSIQSNFYRLGGNILLSVSTIFFCFSLVIGLRNHTKFHWSPWIGKPRMTPGSFVKTMESRYSGCRLGNNPGSTFAKWTETGLITACIVVLRPR